MIASAQNRLPIRRRPGGWWGLAGVVATLALLPLPSSAIIVSASQGNGDGTFGVSTASDYSGVVAILVRKPDGNFPTEGSGVLIDRTHVLTCAHGFVKSDQGLDPRNTLVNVDGVLQPVVAITVQPEYKPTDQYADLAIITLATPAQPRVRSYSWNDGQLDELKIGKCTLAGFGVSGSAEHGFNREAPPGVRRVATNTVDFLSTEHNGLTRPDGSLLKIAPHSLILDFDNHRTPEVNGHPGEAPGHPHVPGKGTDDPSEGITCPGDSGGPLFQLDPKDGRRVVVGIASSGGGPFHGGIGDHSVFIQVAPFSKWITETVQGK